MSNLHSNLVALIKAWRNENRGRAEGALWALSGYYYQLACFLQSFFLTLEGTSNKELPRLEELPDLLQQEGEELRIVQITTSLGKSKLKSSLHEFSSILESCRQSVPELVPRLRFSITCRNAIDQTAVQRWLADIQESSDVPGLDELLTCCCSPLVELALDPRLELLSFLQAQGLSDPLALWEECITRIIDSLTAKSPGFETLAFELQSAYRKAQRSTEHRLPARFLSLRGLDPAPDTAGFRIVVGEVPSPADIRAGCFMSRPTLLQELWQPFQHWLLSSPPGQADVGKKIPLFWIAGRSGDGKSVLMLQLLQSLLNSDLPIPVAQVIPDGLPDVLEWLAYRTNPQPLLLVVDDLFNYSEDEWSRRLQQLESLDTPPVAVLTCGPTNMMEIFRTRNRRHVEICSFHVRPASPAECEQLTDWLAERTATAIGRQVLQGGDEMLLVQRIFELVQGESLKEFATRFRRNLQLAGAFELLNTIVAINMLYLNAPAEIFNKAAEERMISALTSVDYLHLNSEPLLPGSEVNGLRLLHPHLAGQLFRHWWEDSDTAEDVAYEVLTKLMHFAALRPRDYGEYLSRIFQRLIDSSNLRDVEGDDSKTVVRRAALLRRLDAHCRGGSGAEDKTFLEATYLTTAFIYQPWHPELFESLDAAKAALDFLKEHPRHPESVYLLFRLYAKSANAEMVQIALDWLAHNGNHPHAGHFLQLVLGQSPSEAALDLAVKWFKGHPAERNSGGVLAVLLRQRITQEVRQIGVDWLASNLAKPKAMPVLEVLATRYPHDQQVIGLIWQWLNQELQGSGTEQQWVWKLLVALLSGQPRDPKSTALALRLLRQNFEAEKLPESSGPWDLLTTLAKVRPDDEAIFDLSLRALRIYRDSADRVKHRFAWNLLAALIASRPEDEEIFALALENVKLELAGESVENRGCFTLLEAMLARHPEHKELSDTALNLTARGLRSEQMSDQRAALKLFAAMFRHRQQDEATRGRAWEMVYESQRSEDQRTLLSGLVDGTESAEQLQFLRKWIKSQQSYHAGSSAIALILKHWWSDGEIVDAVLVWLSSVDRLDAKSTVLGHALLYLPDNRQLYAEACRLLERHGVARLTNILGALLLVSGGDPDIVRLLSASWEELGSVRGARPFLRIKLGLCLMAHNTRCRDLFNSDQPRDFLRFSAESVALALRAGTVFTSEQTERILLFPEPYAFLCLQRAVHLDVPHASLLPPLRTWLNQNFNRHEYHALMNAVHSNGRIRQLLIEDSQLDPRTRRELL